MPSSDPLSTSPSAKGSALSTMMTAAKISMAATVMRRRLTLSEPMSCAGPTR